MDCERSSRDTEGRARTRRSSSSLMRLTSHAFIEANSSLYKDEFPTRRRIFSDEYRQKGAFPCAALPFTTQAQNQLELPGHLPVSLALSISICPRGRMRPAAIRRATRPTLRRLQLDPFRRGV